MQITINLPDSVVTEFYKRVPMQERTSYLSALLMKDFGLVNHANMNMTVSKKTHSTRCKSLFGFMLDKPFNIPENFDEMYADDIEALFSGVQSSDEHLI